MVTEEGLLSYHVRFVENRRFKPRLDLFRFIFDEEWIEIQEYFFTLIVLGGKVSWNLPQLTYMFASFCIVTKTKLEVDRRSSTTKRDLDSFYPTRHESNPRVRLNTDDIVLVLRYGLERSSSNSVRAH